MERYDKLFANEETDANTLLDQIQYLRNKSAQESEKLSVSCEIQFLIDQAMREQAFRRIPADTLRTLNLGEALPSMQNWLFDSKEGHFCQAPDCQFMHLEKGTTFKINVYSRDFFKATGLVYVCKTTGKVHICGSEKCDQLLVTGKSEGYTCKISGVYFGQVYRAASFGDSRKDTLSSEFCDNTDYTDEGCPIPRDEIPYSPSYSTTDYFYGNGEPPSQDDYPQLHRFTSLKSGVQAPPNIFKKSRKPNPRHRKTLQARNAPKMKTQKENSERSHARDIIAKMFSVDQMSAADFDMRCQEKRTNQEVDLYYRTCSEKKTPVFVHEIVQIITRNTLEAFSNKFRSKIPSNKIIFQDDNVQTPLDYFLEAVLFLWSIVSRTPYALQNASCIKFPEMVVTLMYAMEEGFTVEWCIDRNGRIYPADDSITFGDRPDDTMIFNACDVSSLRKVAEFFSTTTDADNNDNSDETNIDASEKIYLLNLTVIPRHKFLSLVLPDGQQLRNLQRSNGKSSRNANHSHKSYTAASPMHGKKELLKCYSSISASHPHISDVENFILASRIALKFLE